MHGWLVRRLVMGSLVHSNDTSNNITYQNTILKCALKQQRGNLNFCHLNARRMFTKMHEVCSIFEFTPVDFIGVTETWLTPTKRNSSICLPHYNIFRNDRLSRAGGVMLYVREHLKVKIVKNL